MRHRGSGILTAQLPSLIILMTKMHQVVPPLFGDGRLNVSRSLKSRKSRNTKRCCVALTPSSVGFGPGCENPNP